jgi:hypothetical protein
VSMFYWVEGSIAYALIGRFDREQLMNITQTVYREMKIRNVPPAPPPAAPPPEAAKQAPPPPPVGDVKRKDM